MSLEHRFCTWHLRTAVALRSRLDEALTIATEIAEALRQVSFWTAVRVRIVHAVCPCWLTSSASIDA